MSTNHNPLGRGSCGLSRHSIRRMRRRKTRYLKTSIHFEHIREQSGQACSRLVCMIWSRSFKKHACFPQIRDHPDMFPLHDVLEPADHLIDAHGAMMMISETFLWTVRSVQRSTERLGGAGRDRTDDLKLAKLPLSQLSYGPIFESLKRRRLPPQPWLTRRRSRRGIFCLAPAGWSRLRLFEPVANLSRAGSRCQRHRKAERPPRTSSRIAVRRMSHRMVGLGGLEPPTSRLSSARSNQLSYKPELSRAAQVAVSVENADPLGTRPGKKEKRRRRRPACRV